MTRITHILFIVSICTVAAVPCDTSHGSSPRLSKIRYSSHRNTTQGTGNGDNLKPSIRRRAGRGGSSGAGAAGSSASSDKSACFPGSALVNVLGKGVVRMSEVDIGDEVETTKGFSAVYMFGHRVKRGNFDFVRIVTDCGDVAVSAGHYVFAGGRLVTAGSVETGDELEKKDNGAAKILRTEMIRDVGLFNPHTLNGEIVVNGMRMSVYTKSVSPTFANCLLSPIRAVFRALRVDATFGSLNSDISNGIVRALPKGRDMYCQ